MKALLPPVFLILFVLFGGFLLVESARKPGLETGEPFRFRQNSKHAIFKVNTPELLDHIRIHGLVIETNIPDATTIVKIEGHHGAFPLARIQSDGEVYVINPGGVFVGQDSILVPGVEFSDTLITPGVLKKNNYALAISKDGTVQASQPKFQNGDSFLIPVSGE